MNPQWILCTSSSHVYFQAVRGTPARYAIVLRSPASCHAQQLEAMNGPTPFAERVICTIAEACDASGLGRTKIYDLIKAGDLKTITIGRRRLVLVNSLLNLLAPTRA
jgi:excisionase family DNA binding protein